MPAPAYSQKYEHLSLDRTNGVLLVTIDRPDRLNAANARLHAELGEIWLDVDRDEETRVAVITGRGKAFSAGGDLELVREQAGNFEAIAKLNREARDIVLNMIDCEKPVVSAINGVAVGAGLAVALTADISVIGESVRLTDGHLRLGVAAGDHAAIIWPLLCGMAKAKLYLLTSDFIDGREADRIGLVSRCVEDERVLEEAMTIAAKLADGPQHALRWTKRSLNHWLRVATPTFEASLAYEMLNFFGEDVVEGELAVREKRSPRFPSTGER
ncbi:MAG: enoyl-CoA hydratase/isomerase family protein [Solirubrobacterales bacterium]